MFSRGEGGEVGWGADETLVPPGRPPGGVQSAAAHTLPGAFRGAGRARARRGGASGRLGEFWASQEAIPGAIFDPFTFTFTVRESLCFH